jgi:hypothetical protein
MAPSLHTAAAEAGDHPVIEHGARLGYAASAVLHALLAWLALQLALGRSTEADQTGALRQLAGTAAGSVLLWVLLVGFALLGLWQVTEALTLRGRRRGRPAAKAVVYLALAVTTWQVLRGGGGGGDDRMTARVLAAPGGTALVAGVGLVVVGVGAYHVAKGWRSTFLRDLREHPHPWVVRAGRVGYIAKGVALGVVGALLVTAAVNHDPQRDQGLDAALQTLLGLPAGTVLVILVAAGLLCYAVYSLARARYART